MDAAQIVTRMPGSRQISIGAVRSSFKRQQQRPQLPPAVFRRPNVCLEEGSVASYARVCGFSPSQGVPLTYPHILAFPLHMMLMLRPDFPFPAIGLVHLANTIQLHARLNPGDSLTLTAGAGRFIAHEKGQAFTIEVTAERNRRLVWQSTSTYLRRGVANLQGEPYRSLSSEPVLETVSSRLNMPADLGRRYAQVSGDANPIHTSRIGARILGFKRPIAHGMWTKARALAALLPAQPLTRAHVDVAFKTPAYLPASACLLARKVAGELWFEVRDGAAQLPHLRGLLGHAW
jgi:hypothetical protein